MTVETIRPVETGLIARPKGRYTVELFDADSGVLVESRQLDNYISPLYELAMAGLQYNQQWSRVGLANNSAVLLPGNNGSDATGNWLNALRAIRLWNPHGTPALPQDALIITDDDTAEDTDETWLRGNVVAWASRWKATVAASGQRGLINESECTLTNDGATHKTVWDFTTQQGNGTFQTLAIGSVIDHENITKQGAWCAAGPKTIVLDDRCPQPGSAAYSASYPDSIISNMWNDGTNVFWIAPATASTTADLFVYSAPVAAIFGAAAHASEPFALDAGGAGPTSVTDTGINAVANPGGNTFVTNPILSFGPSIGLCRIGSGDFVMAYAATTTGSSTSASGRVVTVRRFNSSTGAQVWSTTPLPAATADMDGVQAGVAYDGTNLYVTVWTQDGAAPGNAIYRINPATGALSATLALPAGISTGQVFGLAFDGTDLLLGTNTGIMKFDTSGNPVSPYNYGFPLSTVDGSTAASPWPTTANLYGSIGRRGTGVAPTRINTDDSFMSAASTNNSNGIFGEIMGPSTTTVIPNFTTLGVRGMVVHAGKLWLVCAQVCHADFAPAGRAALVAVTGANMQSRAVLDSPVTKNTSQNMKITYELTWPLADLTTYPEHRDL